MTHSFVGHQVGPYKVTALLGRGGMGVVYRATDTRLGRDVAMKVLSGPFSGEHDRVRRFEQEARAAAALNHPNILAVFDVGSYEGTSYVITELLDGETLREVLARGALPIAKAIDYAIQVASGLAVAHEKGIVHRDVKPGNMFITVDKRVKILDFGIAKLMQPEDPQASLSTTRLDGTVPGTLIGTIGYMSPEQVRGQSVDHRTDIFSFGAVLYEMVTGRRAFERETPADTLMAILNEAPSYPTAITDAATARVLQVTRTCLEKSVHARFQSCRDLALVLTQDFTPAKTFSLSGLLTRRLISAIGVFLGLVIGLWGVSRFISPPGQHTLRSIAVLPLENLSRGTDDEYLADSMTGALITNLAKVRALKVVSRTSVMRYKRTQKPLPQIGKELNVDAVVEGSIERVANRVRISVQLIRAADDQNLWAETYDRDMRDVLMLQSEVARSVAREVRVTLTPDEDARLAKARRVDPAAYEAYIKGRLFWDRRTDDSIKRAIAFFEEAISHDPSYAAAYSGLADAYLSLGFSFDVGSLPPREAIPQAKAATEKALGLDESLAEAHNSLAYVKFLYDWDFAGAEAEFKRSLDLNPGYAEAHHWYSHLLMASGRVDESLAESNRALALDQVNPILNVHLGWNYLFARQYDRALTQLAKATELDPNYGLAYWYRGLAYEQQGKYADALREIRKAAGLLKGNHVVAADMGHIYAVSGARQEARQVMRELQQNSAHVFVSPFEIALINLGLGDIDRAFEGMEDAYRERSDILVYLGTDPRLEPIRSDPRFQRLAERVGIPK